MGGICTPFRLKGFLKKNLPIIGDNLNLITKMKRRLKIAFYLSRRSGKRHKIIATKGTTIRNHHSLI